MYTPPGPKRAAFAEVSIRLLGHNAALFSGQLDRIRGKKRKD